MVPQRFDAVPARSLLLAAVLLLSANLRGAIAAVSPVLGELSAELGLSGGQAGLLTTVPVLCFAATAPAAAWAARRLGVDRALLVALVLLTVATAVRPFGGVALLFAATLVIGAAMTVGNVLVPVVIKRDFPARAGMVTGLYTAALVVGASVTAALTAPIAARAGWRTALACWAVVGLAAAVLWAVAGRGPSPAPGAQDPTPAATPGLWRHPVALALAALLGTQAATYFAFTAWLPDLLQDEAGLDVAAAGAVMAAFQLVGIVGTLAAPALAVRRPGQGLVAVGVAVLWAVPCLGFMVAPAWWPVWCLCAGIGQGAGISLCFTLVVLRSANAAVAQDLSSMTQTLGYGIGAVGPWAVGVLAELGGWNLALSFLLAVCGVLALAGLRAGRAEVIG